MLKFALPTTPDASVPSLPPGQNDWKVPYAIAKPADVDKLDVLLAPMADAKVSKKPEVKGQAETPKPKGKAKGKKAKAKAKRGRRDDDSDGCVAEVVGADGSMRQTMFGDDVLNAINYTLEKVATRRAACLSYALDLGVLFALESKLDAAGIEKITAWSKARKWIKGYLNRCHALRVLTQTILWDL